jgi:hypothetical protein
MQWPSRQVSPTAQLTAAHLSSMATQAGWQVPPGQPGQVSLQVFSWQVPWTQILPPGQ